MSEMQRFRCIRAVSAVIACVFVLCGGSAMVNAAITIDTNWSIVVGSDVVERTAGEDLRAFLVDRFGVSVSGPYLAENDPGGARVIRIGTPSTLPAVAEAHRTQSFDISGDVSEGYHFVERDGALWIVGATPKGAMNGVFRFQDRLTHDVSGLDESGQPAFRFRVGGHNRTQLPPPGWPDVRQARYYASHYVNVIWGEKYGPPLPYEMRRRYGLGVMLEASLPPTPEGEHWGADGHESQWLADPANASAVYWWGRSSWYGKVKVVDPFDPVGREAYLAHFRRLLETHPDTRVLYCIFGDYSWAPNPDSRRICDGKPYEHSQEETILEIMRLMKLAIGERDIIAATWMWLLHPAGGKEAFMEELSRRGFGVMYNEASDNDCWTYVRDNFDSVSLKTDQTGRSKFGPNYLPLVSLGGTCESVRPGLAMPLPYVGASKLAKLHDAGVANFIIWWGSCESWAYHANLEALAEMIWNPTAFNPTHATPFDANDPEPLLAHIAQRDFGPELAPDILAFWEAFERALIDVDRSGQQRGLQVYSWYQRTGNYLVFLQAHAMPLIPGVLQDRRSVQSLFPWAVREDAAANFGRVVRRLESSVARLDPLVARAPSAEVAWRIESMAENVRLYLRVLTMQYHHMLALRVLEEHPELPLDSPQLKYALLPIIRDEMENTRKLLAMLSELPPNFFLASKHTEVDLQSRDREIARLEQKLEKMRAYLVTPGESYPDLAKAATTSALGLTDGSPETGQVVHEHRPSEFLFEFASPRLINVASFQLANSPSTFCTAHLSTSEDGQQWQEVGQFDARADGLAMAAFEPVYARGVKLTVAADRDAPEPVMVGEVSFYGPPLLRDMHVESGRLQPQFNPEHESYVLTVSGRADRITVRPHWGTALAVSVGGEPVRHSESVDVAVPAQGALVVTAEGQDGQRQRYQFTIRRNLAFEAQATADSVRDAYAPDLAVDGRDIGEGDTSRWLSAGGDGPHWIALDLGEPVVLRRAVVRSGHSNGHNLPIQSFRLQASDDDGHHWRDIPGSGVEGNTRTTCEMTFEAETARHVRLYITQTPGNIARLYEIELYSE